MCHSSHFFHIYFPLTFLISRFLLQLLMVLILWVTCLDFFFPEASLYHASLLPFIPKPLKYLNIFDYFITLCCVHYSNIFTSIFVAFNFSSLFTSCSCYNFYLACNSSLHQLSFSSAKQVPWFFSLGIFTWYIHRL